MQRYTLAETIANIGKLCYNDGRICLIFILDPQKEDLRVRYALFVKPHANVRYAQSLQKLAVAELQCLLAPWAIPIEPAWQDIAGTSFLTFDTSVPSAQVAEAVRPHSTVCFLSQVEDGLLRPIPLNREPYLPQDLAEVPKYKGKTNVDFTRMMLHCALAASDFAKSQEPLTVLDPLCGRGTTLFCALAEGMNALGVDVDPKAIAEADVYFARYLKYHKMKHSRQKASATLPQGKSAPEIRYAFASTPEGYGKGPKHILRLFTGDTRFVDHMVGKESCHVLVGDLPYGVQHAPKEGKGLSSLRALLEGAVLPYQSTLKTGGALALSFNTNTLSRDEVSTALHDAGLHVRTAPPYHDFSHWVEQAVCRDFVIAQKASPSVVHHNT